MYLHVSTDSNCYVIQICNIHIGLYTVSPENKPLPSLAIKFYKYMYLCLVYKSPFSNSVYSLLAASMRAKLTSSYHYHVLDNV